jgi:hypothetical protein
MLSTFLDLPKTISDFAISLSLCVAVCVVLINLQQLAPEIEAKDEPLCDPTERLRRP